MTADRASGQTNDAGRPAMSWAVNFPERAASWKEPYPLDVAASVCAREGIRAIEINYSILEALEPGQLQAAVQILACVGVRILSMHSPFNEPCSLEHPERGKRLAAVDRTIRCLRVCGESRIGRLVIHPSNRTSNDPKVIRDNLCRSIEQLLPAAQETGVILCLENMLPYHAFGSAPQDVAGVVEQFADPHLRAVFDSGHAHGTGAVLEVFEAMRPYIAHTHLHDNNGDRDLHLPPGYGTLPWPSLMPRLLELQLDAPLFVEAPPWSHYTDFARLRLEMTALANACLGAGRFPSLRRPGEGDDWQLRRDPTTGRLIVFDEQGRVVQD